MPNFVRLPWRQDPRFRREYDDLSVYRGREMLKAWASGVPYQEIALLHGTDVPTARRVVRGYLRGLWKAKHKWKQAELRCRELATQLAWERLGKQPPPDQPLESLDPSARALRVLNRAGIRTVNQLRSIDTAYLLDRDHFPRQVLVWAILKLDSLGLSHRLRAERGRDSLPKGEEYRALVGPLPPH
jgi:hypothetical protein